MKKKVLILISVLVMAAMLVSACSKNEPAKTEPTAAPVATEKVPEKVPETTVPETTVPETNVPETTVPETTVPETTAPETSAEPAPEGEASSSALEGPYIVTTCGQSPGAVMISMSAKQAGKVAESNGLLTADDIKAGSYKTLIITTGTSMKGMGAAGTDVDVEIARCKEVMAAAKEAGMKIVCAHVEGMARRVDSMDAASIDAVINECDIILVIKESDSDGFFTKFATEHNLPIITVDNALSIGNVM